VKVYIVLVGDSREGFIVKGVFRDPDFAVVIAPKMTPPSPAQGPWRPVTADPQRNQLAAWSSGGDDLIVEQWDVNNQKILVRGVSSPEPEDEDDDGID